MKNVPNHQPVIKSMGNSWNFNLQCMLSALPLFRPYCGAIYQWRHQWGSLRTKTLIHTCLPPMTGNGKHDIVIATV